MRQYNPSASDRPGLLSQSVAAGVAPRRRVPAVTRPKGLAVAASLSMAPPSYPACGADHSSTHLSSPSQIRDVTAPSTSPELQPLSRCWSRRSIPPPSSTRLAAAVGSSLAAVRRSSAKAKSAFHSLLCS